MDDTLDESENQLEENHNPLPSYQFNLQEGMPIPHALTFQGINIVTGEGEKLYSLLPDNTWKSDCEFGYRINRDLKLSPIRYFIPRL